MAYTERFERALGFAAALHRTQVRKVSRVPYISHLLAVAALAIEAGATEDEAIAALLHDAVEDQGGMETYEAIFAEFGSHVAEIVAGCSDSVVDASKEAKKPWRERKETYIAHLKAASPSVRLVSCADKLHNARSLVRDLRRLGPSLWSHFNGGRDGTLWYYTELTKQYRDLGAPELLLVDLEEIVKEMQTF
ncbi:MAG TPA: HD domain-containing protein [Pirellulales bacterium]